MPPNKAFSKKEVPSISSDEARRILNDRKREIEEAALADLPAWLEAHHVRLTAQITQVGDNQYAALRATCRSVQ